MYIFTHNNRIIHYNAEHHQKCKHRNHIDAHINSRQKHQSANERNGHPHHHPKCKPKLEEHRQNKQNNHNSQHPVFDQQKQPIFVILCTVAVDPILHTRRQGGLKICHDIFNSLSNLKWRLISDSVDIHTNCKLPIKPFVKSAFFKAIRDLCQVRQCNPTTSF